MQERYRPLYLTTNVPADLSQVAQFALPLTLFTAKMLRSRKLRLPRNTVLICAVFVRRVIGCMKKKRLQVLSLSLKMEAASLLEGQTGLAFSVSCGMSTIMIEKLRPDPD